jgi:hypothetical protein
MEFVLFYFICCRLFIGMPEGKRPLGRPRRRWVDNIRMDLGDIGWGGLTLFLREINIRTWPSRLMEPQK